MTRKTPVPVPLGLLETVAAAGRSAEAANSAERAAAAARVWCVVDRLAGGDASGGVDAARFAADLDACGQTIADVRTALDAIAACRGAQAEFARATDRHHATRDEVAAAHDEVAAARAAVEAAELRASRARGASSDADEVLARAVAAVAAARDAEAELRSRGYTGAPIVSWSPPAAPRPRRWRVKCALLDLGSGGFLKRGAVFEAAHDAQFQREYAEPVGPDEPLRLLRPGANEPGGPAVGRAEAMRAARTGVEVTS